MFPTPLPKGYTIYSKTNCPSCDKSKKLLPQATIIKCDDYLDDADAFLDFIWAQGANATKFPMIFLDGTYIGGYSELSKQFNTMVEF